MKKLFIILTLLSTPAYSGEIQDEVAQILRDKNAAYVPRQAYDYTPPSRTYYEPLPHREPIVLQQYEPTYREPANYNCYGGNCIRN